MDEWMSGWGRRVREGENDFFHYCSGSVEDVAQLC